MEAILTRRSIRRYTGEPVTEDLVRQVIRAGAHAPSAHDKRPWRFVVIRDPALLGRLAEVHPFAKMAPSAGTAVAVCGDTRRQTEEGFLVEDCSAAIQNMLLAARGLGLGSVWCGIHPVRRLVEPFREFLGLPDTILPVGLVVLGHPAEQRTVEDRYDESQVRWGTWS